MPRGHDAEGQTPVRVSVAICNYNGRDYLEACLASVAQQTYPVSRVVVYDNASDDDSVAFLRDRFPEVDVVEMGHNGGPSPARNRALDEATTEWVLEVDCDITLEADCLRRLVAEVDVEAPPALVMPRAVFHDDPSRIHYDGGSFHYVGLMTLRHFFAPRPAVDEPAQDVDAAISMALLMHVPTVREVGGYEPGYFILFEDHDLSYRLRAAGHRIRLCPAAVVRHFEGTPGISYRKGRDYPSRRAFLHSRNRGMLLLRNHSWSALLVGAPGLLCYEMVQLLFAAVQGNLGAWGRGKWELLRRLPSLLRQRRQLQARRVVSDRVLLKAERLTLAPMVRDRTGVRAAQQVVDGLLRGWWWVAGWMVR